VAKWIYAGIPEGVYRNKLRRYRSTGTGYTVLRRQAGQRFFQELEDKDERSTSALIEALAPKQEGDAKDTGGGHQPMYKEDTGVIWGQSGFVK
jgi:hypothetical protein